MLLLMHTFEKILDNRRPFLRRVNGVVTKKNHARSWGHQSLRCTEPRIINPKPQSLQLMDLFPLNSMTASAKQEVEIRLLAGVNIGVQEMGRPQVYRRQFIMILVTGPLPQYPKP